MDQTPRPGPPRSAAARWPAGLIGMLALVACVERRVERSSPRFVTIDFTGWARTRDVVGRSARGGVFIFGDSLLKHGLVPAVMAQRLGPDLPASNLALSGGQAPGSYFLLRRLLRAGARPAAVVVDGENLDQDPMRMVRVWPEVLDAADCAELAWTARDARSLAAMTLARVLPTFRTRLEARAAVLDALQGRPPALSAMLPAFLRNWRRNGEALVLPPRDVATAGDPIPAHLETSGYRPASWACHPLNERYVHRLLDLAASQGVPVFWLLPPLHPDVQARRTKFGQDAVSEAFLRALVQHYPRLVVLDGRRAGYPAEAVADTVHLARPGALAFSDAVAAVTADRLRVRSRTPLPDRWVALPRWREGAAAAVEALVAVEDVGQSSEALIRR